MSGPNTRPGILPACLSYLAIYNPSLSTSDESAHDQIVYYYSKDKENKADSGDDSAKTRDQINEQLRQVGLAQGIVQFAR